MWSTWVLLLWSAGKLIGQNGTYIKKLKEECRCNIILKVRGKSIPCALSSIPSVFSISSIQSHAILGNIPSIGDGGGETKEGWENKEREKCETAAKLPAGRLQGVQHRGDQGQHRQVFGHCQAEVSVLHHVFLLRGIWSIFCIISRFIEHREELSFEQVNSSKGTSLPMHTGSVSLSLAEGCMHEVFVSSIVGGGEFTILIKARTNRGKVMSQEANKLQMPFLANSIYSRDPISKMSINCRSP